MDNLGASEILVNTIIILIGMGWIAISSAILQATIDIVIGVL